MNKNKNLAVFVSLLIIIGLFVIVGWVWLTPAPTMVQGEVEARQIKVASKIPGRIESMLVKEGQKVTKGQQLMLLDGPEIRAKLQQAEAAKMAAGAQSKKAQNGARKEQIAAAYNMWQKAKAGAELAQKTFERVNRLFSEGVLPEQKRDEAETQYKAAKVTEEAALAQYEMAKSGARYEDKEAAQALVNKADGAIAEVEAYLKETQLAAPIDGEVADLIAEQGELINTGFPVLTLVDLNDIWVTFQLREDMLAKIRQGDEFEAEFPALGMQKVRLKVTYLKALGDYATWRATHTMGDFDQKTFEVQARPVSAVNGLRPGMTALVNWDEFKPLNR